MLNCKSESLQPLIPSAQEALRSCVGLLRRFSGRYVCGQRSGDLMEEFCRRKSTFSKHGRKQSGHHSNDRVLAVFILFIFIFPCFVEELNLIIILFISHADSFGAG